MEVDARSRGAAARDGAHQLGDGGGGQLEVAQHHREADHRVGGPRHALELRRDVGDDAVAITHLDAAAQLEVAALDGAQQPEALGEQVVRLGRAAAGAQGVAQPAQNVLGQLDELLGAKVVEL